MTRAVKTQLDLPLAIKAHQIFDLKMESQCLKGNPLRDPALRHNYVLLPQEFKGDLPLIFHLSGYFSTGYDRFSPKTLQKNFVEKIDAGVVDGLFPKAVHVFVEASTFWGGSQFINSCGCGRYQDYILKELYPLVLKNFPVTSKPQFSLLMGGSSGGYGALQLVSTKDSPFGVALAVAPDSFFEASLLPELFQAAPSLARYKNFKAIVKKLESEELQSKKSFFNLVNVIAMAHCYSPESAFSRGYLQFPIDLQTGKVNSKLWKAWLKYDPIEFLKKRKAYLKTKKVFLEVGEFDNFSLQFGTRQIHQVLRESGVKVSHTEFAGNHFGLSERGLLFLEKLGARWGARA